MKVIVDIPEDYYLKLKVLDEAGLGTKPIKYILAGEIIDETDEEEE